MGGIRSSARRLLARTPAARLVRPFTGGAGVVLLMHEIQIDRAGELMTGASPAYMERLLRWMQSSGWTFVSLDDMLLRLRHPSRQTRFAALTFDDAYRDNAAVALPIAERLGVPICIFAPTAVLDRTLDSWWLGARQLFRARSHVDVEPMAKRFATATMDQKRAGLHDVLLWALASIDNARALGAWLVGSGFDREAANDRYFMTGSDLAALSHHPLVTIGAHTHRHRQLAHLDEADAAAECSTSKAILQDLLGQEVRHLAYPFGTPDTCGEREFSIAERLGFAAAYTTRSSVVRRDRLDYRAIPRIDVGANSPIDRIDFKISGLADRVAAMGRKRSEASTRALV